MNHIGDRARELQIEAFWDDEQRFYDAMECLGCVENVYPRIRKALIAVGEYPRNPYALGQIIESLKAARKELEEFDTAILDDECVKAAEQELSDA